MTETPYDKGETQRVTFADLASAIQAFCDVQKGIKLTLARISLALARLLESRSSLSRCNAPINSNGYR